MPLNILNSLLYSVKNLPKLPASVPNNVNMQVNPTTNPKALDNTIEVLVSLLNPPAKYDV